MPEAAPPPDPTRRSAAWNRATYAPYRFRRPRGGGGTEADESVARDARLFVASLGEPRAAEAWERMAPPGAPFPARALEVHRAEGLDLEGLVLRDLRHPGDLAEAHRAWFLPERPDAVLREAFLTGAADACVRLRLALAGAGGAGPLGGPRFALDVLRLDEECGTAALRLLPAAERVAARLLAFDPYYAHADGGRAFQAGHRREEALRREIADALRGGEMTRTELRAVWDRCASPGARPGSFGLAPEPEAEAEPLPDLRPG